MITRLLMQITDIRVEPLSPAEYQQARRLLLINLAWLILILMVLPVVITWAFQLGSVDAATVFTPITLVIAVLIHLLIKRGQIEQARLLFVLNILATSLLATFPEYRIDNPFIVTLFLPLTAAGVLLTRTRLLAVTLLLIAIFSVGGVLQLYRDMQPTLLGDSTESIGTTLALVVAVILLNWFMQWSFLSSIDDTLREQRRIGGLISTTTEISQALSALTSTTDTLNQVAEQLREAFGLYHVQVFIIDPNTGLALLQASTGYIGRRILEEHKLLIPDETSPINDTLRRKDPLLIRDDDPETLRKVFLPATRSELLLPLRVGNLLPIGVLDLHSTDRNAFSDQRLAALTTLSFHLAAVLYNLQQTKELRAAHEEQNRLSAQLESGQRELSRLNRQLVSATWGTYLQEHHEEVPGFDWKPGAVMAAQRASERLNQALEDGQAAVEQIGDQSVLSVPIRLRGQTLGAVEFRRSDAAPWSPAALELVQTVAERIALSLENARLFEQAQGTAQREQLVNKITSQLQTTSDLHSLLTLAAEQFRDALGATQTRVRLGAPAHSPADHSG
jgi:GAF domain-containing protein